MDELLNFMRRQAEKDASALDLIATGFDHVAADLAAAGVNPGNTRKFADHLHGLALEFTVGSPA